jgi:tRNA (cytosine49-C5)-methyltransferase
MLPAEFLQRFSALCPDEFFEEGLAAFNASKWPSFRVNQLRAEPEAVLAELDESGLDVAPVSWAQEAGIAAFQCPPEQRESLTHSAAAEAGDIYIQSLSSMLAPLLLQPQEEDWVLDLAAAPGGKTILLAEMMGDNGKISAVEPVRNRFFRLKANLERCGVENTRVYLKDGRAVGKLKPESFDRVLLDAPCSSESRFRAGEPGSYSHWNLRKVKECAQKQKRLILSAFDALQPGGLLCYCTCSYSPEENEAVVAHLLKKREGVELCEAELPVDNYSPGITEWQGRPLADDCSQTLRVWPTEQMDGFFLALIRKAA